VPRDSEAEVLDRFRTWYGRENDDAFRQIELRVIGSDYGANGYTTKSQVDDLVRRIAVGPGDRLLDVGTGCGWPALYIAHETGCTVVASDVPVEGLRAGARRARREGLGARALLVCAGAESLPFRAQSFEAVVHTDVLC